MGEGESKAQMCGALLSGAQMSGLNCRCAKFTERCTAFEHAAPYDYARFVVENEKEKYLMQTVINTY